MLIGRRTHYTKKELLGEILNRMNALDTTDEEYSNPELLADLVELFNDKTPKQKESKR